MVLARPDERETCSAVYLMVSNFRKIVHDHVHICQPITTHANYAFLPPTNIAGNNLACLSERYIDRFSVFSFLHLNWELYPVSGKILRVAAVFLDI